MKSKLQKAIANNNGLYKVIFSQYRIKSESNDFIWYCLEETPLLYSNLVTIAENWEPDEIFRQIDRNYHHQNWSEWSIKDSFAVLDLTEFGFSKLFAANWFYLESEKFSPISESKNLHYEIVENDEVLAKWKFVWDADEELRNKIFSPKLLNNQDVFFVAGFEAENLISGCFVNKTDDVFGISNFFAPDKNLVYWSDLIQFIYNSIDQKDIVGYERSVLTEKLKLIGFGTIGDLTVWLKKTD